MNRLEPLRQAAGSPTRPPAPGPAGLRILRPVGWQPRALDLRPMRSEDADAVARLHCAVLSDGFLVQLGWPVLAHVYAGALGDPNVIAMIAEANREIAGFLLATLDTGALFRRVLVRRGARLLGVMLLRALRRPAAIGRILETARYPRRVSGDPWPVRPPSAELISIGLAPSYRDRGNGTALIGALNQELVRRGVGAYTVSAYADNTQANALYERLGFELTHHFEMYGRRWKAYRLELAGDGRADLVSAARMPRG